MNGRASSAALAAPFVIGIVVTVVGPGAAVVVLALFDWDLVGSPEWIGFANVRALLDDDVFRIALRNSLAFVAIAVPLRVFGALSLALLLHRPGRGAGAYRSAVLAPTVVPDVAYAITWTWIANPLFGPLNLSLASLGLRTPAWLTEPLPAQALVIAMSVFTLGEGFVLAVAVRNQLPERCYDVAVVEGIGTLGTFRRITLPMMAPALLLLAMRDAAFSFQATFVPSLVVTEGGPPPFSTTYLPLLAYRTGFEYLRFGYAAAVTVVMLSATVLILVVQRGFIDRRLLGWR